MDEAPLLRTVARIAVPATVLASLFVFFQGHNLPGGGFIAGSQLNVGVALYYDSAIDALQDIDFFLSLPKDVYSGLFKAFVFGNPYKFYTEANPRFFEGTQVEAKLREAAGARAAE